MKEVSKREGQPLAELFDWFDGGWPAFADWRRGAPPCGSKIAWRRIAT